MLAPQLAHMENAACRRRQPGYSADSWENHMAERKSALRRAPQRPELDRLLEQARTTVVTEEVLREQRASFVYGNAPRGSRITKESARAAVGRIRVTPVR
jgi:hypothetical protein